MSSAKRIEKKNNKNITRDDQGEINELPTPNAMDLTNQLLEKGKNVKICIRFLQINFNKKEN